MSLHNSRVLIVDDEADICLMLSHLMEREGLLGLTAQDGETAIKLIALKKPDLILVDIKMPGMGGMELLKWVKEFDPDLPVIMITAFPHVTGAVDAMKAGAHDYLPKPFEHTKVVHTVRRALKERAHRKRLLDLADRAAGDASLRELMGGSESVMRIIEKVHQVAKSEFSVLIQGETGAGKDLVARAIHQLSPRAKGPFIPVDCGAIPDTLIESELFGYQKGAFTGAVGNKPGKFEVAKGGTLFLDEISNLPLCSQAKLLRALQEKEVCRLGATTPLMTDVRLLAATNQDLTHLDTASMRSDLFFRLNEFTLVVPPLRERKEDIPYLCQRFLSLTNAELHKTVNGISDSCMELLVDYNWPGNVRQLRSVMRRAVLVAEDTITERHIDIKKVSVSVVHVARSIHNNPWNGHSLKEIVRDEVNSIEKQILIRTMEYTGGNKAEAARLLHIDYKTIHTKLKQFGFKKQG
ncbi:sigma-54-dependent transcriptional regulator [Solidesulfovibrio sp. C21]|uniref:sigma-54-dependent transcriptional regulator n=1 Tax=Solidesulfovibrio sp. C21 TaxID=3398613 RepID=UPI0039FC670F